MREELIKFLLEVPGDTVILRLMDGRTFTATAMIAEVESKTDMGNQYATEVFRVARDLIIRQAKKV